MFLRQTFQRGHLNVWAMSFVYLVEFMVYRVQTHKCISWKATVVLIPGCCTGNKGDFQIHYLAN